MGSIRRHRKWWAGAVLLLGLPALVRLTPSLAASSGAARYAAMAPVGENGVVVAKDDGSMATLGDAGRPVAFPTPGDADVVDIAVGNDASVLILQKDGTVSQRGGLSLTCPKVSPWWPATGIALTADGRGAWIAALNGQVVNCGTAADIGPRDPSYIAPVAAIAATADGKGYYLLTASGEVLPFGGARAFGSGAAEGSRFIGIVTTRAGYWLARADGRVQNFGDAPALDGLEDSGLTFVDIASTPARTGYRLLASSGQVYTVGPIATIGSTPPPPAVVLADSFEKTNDGWDSWWGPPMPQLVTDAHEGRGALMVPGHWSTFGNVTRSVTGLEGGRTYSLSYWVKGDAVVGGEFNLSPLDWSTVTSGLLPQATSSSGEWTKVTMPVTMPAGAQRLWMGLYASTDFVLDDVELVGPVNPDQQGPGPVTSVGTTSTSGAPRPTVPVTTAPAPATTTATTTGAPATTAGPPATTAPAATTTTAPRPPVATTLPATPPPAPRVGRPPSGPDDIDARVCGSARLLGGPTSAAAAGALYAGRTVVTVPAGDNSGAFSGGAGTVYWFAPGRHTLGSSPFGQIQPKDDDVYIGAPGAVLDGAATNRYAFVGHAQRVAIRYLTITGFDAPVNEGVVNHDSGDHWLIEFSTVRANGGGGMMAGNGQVVRQSCLAENGQYGFNAYQGGDGITDVVFDHNEIMGNNTGDWEVRQPGCGCTGGGKFWAVRGARITNNWVHDNHSVGIWADTNNIDFLFERNVVDHNDNVGIWYEISYNARIVDNLLTRNGWVSGRSNQGAPAPAIYLSESGGDSRLRSTTAGAPIIEITGNQLVDNFSGITLYENTNRFCNSNGNSSTGYCTPFVGNGKIPAPQQYGYGQPINPSHQCNAPGIASEPLYTDCRWRTQHVSIHDNALAFNPSVVPCAGKFCGAMSLYGSGSDNQSWQPYTVAGTLDALSFGQDNRWRNNIYQGPWKFMTRFGDQVDLATWRGTYAQDQGSSFG